MERIQDARILIVDDNYDLLEILQKILKEEGFINLITACNCENAKETVKTFDPHLIILDIMLPDGDGFTLFRELRAISDVPTLFLSAKDEDQDRLFGLGLGADDYLTKPFLTQELILRIQLILKRTYFSSYRNTSNHNKLLLPPCEINFSDGSIVSPSGTFTMTAKEMTILKKLNMNRGNIVTFDAICNEVWGDGYYGYENTLMVHIRHLREKIEETPSCPKWILTVRGLGYKLVKKI